MSVLTASLSLGSHLGPFKLNRLSGTYGQFAFIVRGINTTNLIAGRIEMCVDSESRAMMCHDGWGFGNDALGVQSV